MKRKAFATPIDENILEEFKIKCKHEGYKLNEVIEVLMAGYVNGKISIEKEIKYTIHQKEEN